MLNNNSFLSMLTVFSAISSLQGLDYIIPPEVKNDSFYKIIYELASSEKVNHILEIGSSSGEGSTEAFVLGIRKNNHKPNLYCMEISKPRFKKLKEHYHKDSFVHCFNLSSVSSDLFPDFNEVESFMSLQKGPLNHYGVETVKTWYKQDIDYLKNNKLNSTGIEAIKTQFNISKFDIVLIDGSEFTGKAEMDLVYGAKYVLLDDILTFKNFHNCCRLENDPNYVLLEKNETTRNGYAVFKLK